VGLGYAYINRMSDADPSSLLAAKVSVSERERFDLESRRAMDERLQRELELELRREEVKRHSVTPLVAAVVAGVVALAGNAVVAIIQGQANRDLERRKLEAQLISKAVDVNDHDAAARNLAFLISTGLVEDREGRIASLVKEPKRIPVQNVGIDGLVEVAADSFEDEVLKSPVPTIVLFTAPWAGPGRAAEVDLLAEASKTNEVKIRKINLDKSPDLARKYAIRMVPVFTLFVKGVPARTEYGAISPEAVRLLIEVARLQQKPG
jgi:thioredoxin